MNDYTVMIETIKLNSFRKPDTVLAIQNNQFQLDKAAIRLVDISEFKFGVKPIVFYKFSVGRTYYIELRNQNDYVAVFFDVYFGISHVYFSALFEKILDIIWEPTAVRLFKSTIEGLIAGAHFKVGNCLISKDGILLSNFLITWNDFTYQRKYDRLTLNSKSNRRIWTNMYYSQVFNVEVLLHVLEWVFQKDGLSKLRG